MRRLWPDTLEVCKPQVDAAGYAAPILRSTGGNWEALARALVALAVGQGKDVQGWT